MAQAKENRIAGKLLGAGLALSAAFSPMAATAQDATPVNSLETVDTVLCHDDRTYLAKDGWNSETADLSCATHAASEYAESHHGVGILIHVGQDLPYGDLTADKLGQILVSKFKKEYGTDAQYFLRQNDARATAINYHLGEFMYGAVESRVDMDLKEALAAMPEAAGLLNLIWEEKVASNEQALDLGTAPQPGG